jgi:undecaprenyl-diphosphatase
VGRFGPPLTGRSFGLPLWIAAACVAAFTAIAVDVTHEGPLARHDQHVAHWAAGRPVDLRRWASHVSLAGNAAFLAVLVVLVVAYLLTRDRRVDAAVLVAAAASTGLVTTLLKLAFRRARPPFVDEAARLHSFSFPSGHASGAFAVYLLFALLLTDRLRRRWRAGAVGAAVLAAMLVAATRVLIPVHYLSDVIAGSAEGIAAAAIAWLVRDSFWRRR